MSPPIKPHDMTSPPEAGEAKIRIKSGGSIDTTHVVVVDEHGVELDASPLEVRVTNPEAAS